LSPEWQSAYGIDHAGIENLAASLLADACLAAGLGIRGTATTQRHIV
jgi:hypothetical protein